MGTEDPVRLLEIAPLIDRVESLFEKETADQALRGELAYFKGYLHLFQGQTDLSVEFFRKAQDLLPKEEKYDSIAADTDLCCAMALQIAGKEEIAVGELKEKVGSHRTRRGVYFTRLLGAHSYVRLLSGDLRQAEEAAVQVREASRRSGIAYADTWSDYFQACCCFHAYDLEGAHRHFAAAVEQKHACIPFKPCVAWQVLHSHTRVWAGQKRPRSDGGAAGLCP